MSWQRKKGTKFETEVVEFLRAHGFPYAERRAMRGTKDAGDVAGIPGIAIEVKNHREMSLGEWMTEAQKEAINAGCYRHVVWHKRRGKGVRDSFVTMPAWLFAELLAEHVVEAVS